MLNKGLFAASLCASALFFTTSSNASLTLFLDDGSTSFTVADGGAGDLDGLVNGSIIFTNSFAGKILPGFTSLFITSNSNAPGSSTLAGLNTTTLEFTSGAGAKSLDVFVSDLFSLPGISGDLLGVTNSVTANYLTGGMASATQTTELDGIATPIASVAVSSGLVVDGDVTTALLLRGGPTFSLETLLSTSMDANSNASFTSISSAVIPEPMTIAVWAGLFGFAAIVAHRRRKVA